MLNILRSNMLQINIANKRHIPMETFIERYACRVRDLIEAGIEDEVTIDSILEKEESLH